MRVFDILGPVMVGPSSSHTAGACRLAMVARALLDEKPVKAVIRLYGSFAKTYSGHCTDRAIIGGLLGYSPDDDRLRDSFSYADKEGLSYSFETAESDTLHPNTADITLTGETRSITVTASSIGGGAIKVVRINGAEVEFSAEYPTTILFHKDVRGIIAKYSELFSRYGVNIAFLRVYRHKIGSDAITVLESDQSISEELLGKLREIETVDGAVYLPAVK